MAGNPSPKWSIVMAHAPQHLDIKDILERLPHRYPFLLVDRILEYAPGKRIVGLKNVSINEPFFAGHLPGNPILPSVLLVEAMAQVAALLVLAEPGAAGKTIYLVGINEMDFRRPVRPGDQLITTVVSLGGRARFGKAHATAAVGGETAAAGELMYGLA